MILFLDFDGVLHPEVAEDDALFSAAPLLCRLLEACPHAGKNVVVSHHLPSMQSVAERFHKGLLSTAFASNLDRLVEQADLWIHGHTHDNFDYRLGKCRVICNPRGYVAERYEGRKVENLNFKEDLVCSI